MLRAHHTLWFVVGIQLVGLYHAIHLAEPLRAGQHVIVALAASYLARLARHV